MDKKNNILGIEVSVLHPEKAVNQTMEYLTEKKLHKIFFLTAKSSLHCKNHPAIIDLINNCDLILPGDVQTEKASKLLTFGQDNNGLCKFTEEYLSELFKELSKKKSQIYVVMENEEHLDAMKTYLSEKYPDLMCDGYVFEPDEDKSPDVVVNEINAVIPDVVFLCLSLDAQFTFLKDYQSMMNAGLLICIENMQAHFMKATEEIPEWVKNFHMVRVYRWFRKEQKLQHTIINSIFKRQIKDEISQKEETDSAFTER